MKALPLSTAERGIRSVAFQATVGGTRLFFNPGVACDIASADLATLTMSKARLIEAASKAQAIIITGYAPYHHNLLPDLPAGQAGLPTGQAGRPLSTPLYLKTPTTAQELQLLRAHFLPLAQAGRRVSLLEGAHLRIGEAEVEGSPRLAWSTGRPESQTWAVTVRGEGRTVIYVSEVTGPFFPVAQEYLIGQRPDLLYLGVADCPWSPGQLAALARDLLALLAATGCRILLAGVPLWDAGCRKLLQEPLATGRVTTPEDFLARSKPVLTPAVAGRLAA